MTSNIWGTIGKWFQKQWQDNQDVIIYELKSLIKTFIAGALGYLLMEWGHLDWHAALDCGFWLAVARSGIKTVWALLEPQILGLMQKEAVDLGK